ncbi:hypothetical protein QBC38DRAFT_380851 [Podospora fimiseda]|uniref:Uncharacterized protein n=1 Tax=Podospora fimiseda TaxID=252190 RepID=A0AAN7H839_9PEZI|nr:hypothetical protein QBC38DRAFT_380851 [Podospora fimiseda]
MSFFKSLFCHKDSTPPAPIPSLSDEIIPLSTPWKGNLPCVHGPNDGCKNHNPSHSEIHFDSSLFLDNETLKPVQPKPVAHHHHSTSSDSSSPQKIEILSNLPRDLPASGVLSCLPKIHKSLPYTLSFYHLSSFSSIGSCQSKTGSNPLINWTATPLVKSDSLYIRFTLSFTLQTDLGGWTPSTPHARSIVKNGLIGSGYRDFKPCLHTHIKFTSHKGEGKDHVRYAGVNYTIRDSEGQGRSVEWRSEVDGNEGGEKGGCGKCETDFKVICRFEDEESGRVGVEVKVWKGLGEGSHPGEGEWLGLTRREPGEEMGKRKGEVGGVERIFEEK